MSWFDSVKRCVGWNETDRSRIAELRRWLDSGASKTVEELSEQLAQVKDVQPLMANRRFVGRLRDVLREWLMGLLDGTFDEAYVEKRQVFGQKMAKIDLTFRDVILLEGLARQHLFAIAQHRLGGEPQKLSSTMHTLDKALNLDTALIYVSFLQTHDAEMERELLNRFLTITGFSPTLYESLAESLDGRVEGR